MSRRWVAAQHARGMRAARTEQHVCLRARFLRCCTDVRLYKPAVRAFIDLKVGRQRHCWWPV